MSRALRLLTHLNLLAPCGGFNCRVIISPGCASPAERCCLGVHWASWASPVSVGLLVALVGLHNHSLPADLPMLFWMRSVILIQTSQRLFGGSIPCPRDGLFHLCQKAAPVELGSTHLPHFGLQAALGRDCRSTGVCLGPRRKDGHTWAQGVLWGVLLGAGTAEKCVLLGGSESTGCRLSSGCSVCEFVEWVCPFLRTRRCCCALLVAVN